MITFSSGTMVKAVAIILFCAIAHSAISLHLGQEAGPQEKVGPQEAGPQERAGPQEAAPQERIGPLEAGPQERAGPQDC